MQDKSITELEAARLRCEIAEVKLENARRLIEVRALHRCIERKSRSLKALRFRVEQARAVNRANEG